MITNRRNKDCITFHLSYPCLMVHSANDITLIPLELSKSNRDSVRKAREAYLIERDKTLEPLGMNKKDEM